MSKLHRLPDGTWIDLSLVTGIVTQPVPQIEVLMAKGYYIIPAKSIEDAQRMADELAALVNTVQLP